MQFLDNAQQNQKFEVVTPSSTTLLSPSIAQIRTALESGQLLGNEFYGVWRQVASRARLEGNLNALRLLLSLLEKSAVRETNFAQLLYHEYSGSLLVIEGLFDKARFHFKLQRDLAELTANPTELALAYLHLARVDLYEFKLVETEKMLQVAGQWAGASGDPELVVKTLNRQAELATYRHLTAHSLATATRALELARYHKLPLEEAFALNWLGANYIYQREWYKAEDALMEATKLRQQASDVLGRAETLAFMGRLYLKWNDLAMARSCIEGSLAIVQQLQNRPGMAQAFYQMAQLLLTSGEPDVAVTWAMRAVELRLELEELHKLAESFSVLGKIYAAQRQHTLALACHLKVLEFYQLGDFTPIWIELLVNASDYLLDVQSEVSSDYWPYAQKGYQQSIEIMEQNEELYYLAPTLGRMGRALLKLDGYKGLHEAVRCYRLQLRLLGDIESSFFPIADAIAQRAQALSGLQVCNSLLRRLQDPVEE